MTQKWEMRDTGVIAVSSPYRLYNRLHIATGLIF